GAAEVGFWGHAVVTREGLAGGGSGSRGENESLHAGDVPGRRRESHRASRVERGTNIAHAGEPSASLGRPRAQGRPHRRSAASVRMRWSPWPTTSRSNAPAV